MNYTKFAYSSALLLFICLPGTAFSAECRVNDKPVYEKGVLFQENFDSQADWTSGDNTTQFGNQYAEHGIPVGWFAARERTNWAPSKGHSNNKEGIEILSENSNMAHGGSGKSAVFWRESTSSSAYSNDKMLIYKFDEAQKSLYAEFLIKFSPDFEPSGSSKIFRIYAWDEENAEGKGPTSFFSTGASGPIFLWKYSANSYGVRNATALRGGPYSENYTMTKPDDYPRSFISGSLGDSNMNFTDDIIGQESGGATAQLVDKLNGGIVPNNGTITHEQIFGRLDGQNWTKVAFYVKQNSAPGVADGILAQWIDDKRVVLSRTIPWVGISNRGVRTADWNMVALGGNEALSVYPDSARFEDWYAIDNLVVRDNIPDNLSIMR